MEGIGSEQGVPEHQERIITEHQAMKEIGAVFGREVTDAEATEMVEHLHRERAKREVVDEEKE